MLKNYLPTRLIKTKVATGRDNQNTVSAAIVNPADVKTPDTCFRTPLHRACWDGDEDKVKELLIDTNSKAVNAKDLWGRTPLWCAVNQGQLGVVRIMVENVEVNLETKDSYGKDLEFRAKEKGFIEILEVIQKEKQRRQLTIFSVNDCTKSEGDLIDDLEKTKKQLFDLEKRHANEKMDFEMSCSEAVEKLLEENEEKLKKLQGKQENEREILTKQIQTIEQNIDTNQSDLHPSSAPEYQPESYTQHLPPCPECPVCMENLMPPRRIFQCANGHLICEICQPKMKEQKCPTCQQVFVGRAIAMEQHLRTLFMN